MLFSSYPLGQATLLLGHYMNTATLVRSDYCGSFSSWPDLDCLSLIFLNFLDLQGYQTAFDIDLYVDIQDRDSSLLLFFKIYYLLELKN